MLGDGETPFSVLLSISALEDGRGMIDHVGDDLSVCEVHEGGGGVFEGPQ